MNPSFSKPIFIIGLPGSGKSKYGKRLATYLGWKYLDSDTEIEKTEKRSIAQIFDESGEDYFRKLESEFLQSIPSGGNIVISTGGGMPCHNNLLQIIKEKGNTIYLQIPPQILASRLQSDDTRPMFKNLESGEILDLIYRLLAQREKYYLQADKIIEFDGEDIWKKLKTLMSEWEIIK